MTLILYNDWKKSMYRRSHVKALLGILFFQTPITCRNSIISAPTSQNEKNLLKMDKLMNLILKVRLKNIRRLCAVNNQIWSWFYSICLLCPMKLYKNSISIVAGREDLNETWKSSSRISQFIGSIRMKTLKKDISAMSPTVKKTTSSWKKTKKNSLRQQRKQWNNR